MARPPNRVDATRRLLATLWGERTYIPEKPCCGGHHERAVSDGHCLECQAIHQLLHRERVRKDGMVQERRANGEWYRKI